MWCLSVIIGAKDFIKNLFYSVFISFKMLMNEPAEFIDPDMPELEPIEDVRMDADMSVPEYRIEPINLTTFDTLGGLSDLHLNSHLNSTEISYQNLTPILANVWDTEDISIVYKNVHRRRRQRTELSLEEHLRRLQNRPVEEDSFEPFTLLDGFFDRENELTRKWIDNLMPTIFRDYHPRHMNWMWLRGWLNNHSRFPHRMAMNLVFASMELRKEVLNIFRLIHRFQVKS